MTQFIETATLGRLSATHLHALATAPICAASFCVNSNNKNNNFRMYAARPKGCSSPAFELPEGEVRS